jgi:branched-chain amino acid transport system permease protein
MLRWTFLFVLAASLPWWPEPVGSRFHLELGAQVLTMAIFALSLQLMVGFTGLVSLGHAAFFGAAAYTTVLLAPQSDAGNGWLLMTVSVLVAALLAFLIGLFVMRTKGVYFIMVTLAFAQLVYFVVHDTNGFGGSDGAYLYFKPEFNLGASKLVDLDQPAQLYWFSLALTALTAAVLGLVLRARLGHAFVGIRHNEQRMRAAGFPTLAYKLASFTLGGALAGLAGFLYAARTGYVNPELLSWHQSGNALLMIILGGLGSLGGAIAGAVAFVLLSEWFSGLTKHWQLLLGGFIIVIVAVLPQGLMGGLKGMKRPHRPVKGTPRVATASQESAT